MRLARLLLRAFGPFTDAELDLGRGDPSRPDLHLIYGPNEAGKSSALRAMTDLRFGIPQRSPDDFTHPFSQLRIGGVFEDERGQAFGLMRRKGRGLTLSALDPATGEPLDPPEVAPALVQALTAGLDRDGFEAMFGLNHERLRDGGRRLLRGEGDLGSALFEASAGTRGIAGVLAALEADAKTHFNPNPRDQSAAFNAARRVLDEQRQVWRQAQTRPAEWQTLQRAHTQARDALAEIDRDLEAQRRRDNELTELRAVAPLLQAQDRAGAEVAALAAVPDLPEDAREQRLAALQALERAVRDRRGAQDEAERCTQALAALVIEAQVLAQGEAIERLAAGLDALAHSRVEVERQAATCARIEVELEQVASRIAVGLPWPPGTADISETQEQFPIWGELRSAAPSAADRVTLDGHLAAVARLRERLAGLRSQAEGLQQTQTEAPPTPAPDPQARRALTAALRRAQGLGDVQGRINDLGRDHDDLDRKLHQALADLGLRDAADLRLVRPLLEAQIAAARDAQAALQQESQGLADEDRRLVTDLAEQRLRERGLAATGEVVTAETLRQARERRDLGWSLVRRSYVEGEGDSRTLGLDFDPDRPLPEAFEAAQAGADRQADLLRSDAERAAVYADCAKRIEQMEARRTAIAEAREEGEARRLGQEARWAEALTQAGLPALEPQALREWQAGRLAALDIADRQARVAADLAQRRADLDAASQALAAALIGVGVGETPAAAITAGESLAGLVDQAARWEAGATRAEAQQGERARAEAERRVKAQRVAADMAQVSRDLNQSAAALHAWHARLALPVGAVPEVLRARLAELDHIDRQALALEEARHQRALHQAQVDDFGNRAADLAPLLSEPLGALEPWVEGLRQRLRDAREQDRQRQALTRDRTKAEAALRRADVEAAAQTAALERLCLAAGVSTAADLPEREEAAARKRGARSDLERQRRQLAAVTARPEDELRERLAGQDGVAIGAERERTQAEIARLEQAQTRARQVEEQTRRDLEAVDAGDAAANAREAMESALARCRAAVLPWARLRLAQALLREALGRFREQAQAPMVAAASAYFALMTDGRYVRLLADEEGERPVLKAVRPEGDPIGVEAMSEGTADQLYLALRLAALELRRQAQPPMPLILDDCLVTSDDARAVNILTALARFAQGGQVLLFTHHRHLIDLAQAKLGATGLWVHTL